MIFDTVSSNLFLLCAVQTAKFNKLDFFTVQFETVQRKPYFQLRVSHSLLFLINFLNLLQWLPLCLQHIILIYLNMEIFFGKLIQYKRNKRSQNKTCWYPSNSFLPFRLKIFTISNNNCSSVGTGRTFPMDRSFWKL